MKGFDFIKTKSAVSHRDSLDLSRTHITSSNFGEIDVVFHEELLNGDDFDVSPSCFSRCAPLVVPTYGQAKQKAMAVFVPYYQIAKDADAYINGQTSYHGNTVYHRYITIGTIVDFLLRPTMSTLTPMPSSGSGYDFVIKNSAGDVQAVVLTVKGRYVYKILRQLGYQFPANVDMQTGYTYYNNSISKVHLSAYPLLAFAKAYSDWMAQSVAFNTLPLTNLLYNIKLGNSVTYSAVPSADASAYNGQGAVGIGFLFCLFDSLLLTFDNDYFTSAWRYPNAPLDGAGNGTATSPNPLNAPAAVGEFSTVTATNYTNKTSPNTWLSQYSLDLLQRFDAWVRRNNYAGSRDVEQIYSRFGIRTEDFKAHFAHMIKTFEVPFQVGDVTSVADTNGAVLGEYAGKGIIAGDSSFSYKSKDNGMLFVISWIAVRPSYADGFDKAVLRSDPFDYYTPEFDAMGPQPISLLEVGVSNKKLGLETSTALYNINLQNTFGFTERYNDYKYGRDQVTGDMVLYDEFDAWHFNRDLASVAKTGNITASDAGNLRAQSPQMVYHTQFGVASEFNRIFNISSGDEDKFYQIWRFKVNAVRPMMSLNKTARLGDGNRTLSRNGNNVQ